MANAAAAAAAAAEAAAAAGALYPSPSRRGPNFGCLTRQQTAARASSAAAAAGVTEDGKGQQRMRKAVAPDLPAAAAAAAAAEAFPSAALPRAQLPALRGRREAGCCQCGCGCVFLGGVASDLLCCCLLLLLLQKRNTARGRAEDKTVKEPKSQLKTNQAAMTIKCKVGSSSNCSSSNCSSSSCSNCSRLVCLQPFMKTQSSAQLAEHAKNKHSKTLDECFPDVASS
ncbi:hypothetical protein Efla_002539 [Eimeria flavescens]